MVPKTTGWNGEHTLPISTPSMPLGYSGPWCLTAYPSPMQIPGNQATCYVGLERYWYWVIGQYSQILDSIASGGYFFVQHPIRYRSDSIIGIIIRALRFHVA